MSVGTILLVILVLAWMFVPNTSSATAKKVDLPGVLLASAALFLLVFPLKGARRASEVAR